MTTKVVDNYQIDEQSIINDNGVQIYTAKHIQTKQLFTLKKINTKLNSNLPQYNGLLNQLSLLKQLANDHIIKCHKMLKTTNNIYLVYDFNPPMSLFSFIKTSIKKISSIKKQQLVLQICKALKHMKSKGIVHLNLTPSNIFLDQKLNIKIGSFCYGEIINDQNQIILNSIPPQTQFVAPEVLTKKTCTYSSDVYSLGKIMYALQLSNDQTNLLSITPILSQQTQLTFIMKKMISKNPIHRIQIQELEAYLQRNDLKRMSKTPEKNNTILKTINQTASNRSFGRMNKNLSLEIEIGGLSQRSKVADPQKSKQKTPHKDTHQQKVAFKDYMLQILKSRNLSVIMLQFSNIVTAIKVKSQTRAILSYLYFKKSLEVIEMIVQHFKTNNDRFMIGKQNKQYFPKKAQYKQISELIINQSIKQKQIFEQTKQDIKNNYPQLLKNEKFNNQFCSQTLQNKYLKQTVFDFLKQCIKDEMILKNLQKKTIVYMSLVSEILSFDSYEKFFQDLINQKNPSLQSQSLLLHLRKMTHSQIVANIQKKLRRFI